MPDNTSIYADVEFPLTLDEIEGLAVDGATVFEGPNGQIVVQWPDVTVILNTMTQASGGLEEHLDGFKGFILEATGGDQEFAAPIINAISDVKVVTGCVIEPAFDSEFKAKSLIISIACSYEAFMFFEGNLYTPFGEVWVGADDAEQYADIGNLTVRKCRVEGVETTENQEQRTQRVNEILKSKGVPLFDGHIRWMRDDEEVTLRDSTEVARRILALHGVVCAARGRDMEEVMEDLRNADVMDALTPNESAFLNNPSMDDDVRMPFIWQLECLWVFMWSIRAIDKFNWPSDMCDVDGLHDLIFEKTKDPQLFIAQTQTRSRKSILDATELMTRIHWAIRQAMIDETPIPTNMNWNNPSEMAGVYECPTVGVVAERHRALNWLTRYDDDDWDDVETPT